MTQLGEAIARYHKLLEAEPFKDLSWANALQQKMVGARLTVGGRPISPVLRPHFITRRQYTGLVKAAESLVTSVERLETMAVQNPLLMSRMELLPAEKMLATVNPGYPCHSVTSLINTHLHNGTMRFAELNTDTPSGIAYADALSDLFYDAPPMKEFRKRYALEKLPGMGHLVDALRQTYAEFSRGQRPPSIGILEFKQPFQTAESNESALMAEYFRRAGMPAEVVWPEQLEYKNNVLRRADFPIALIFRRIKVHEFLIRYDLSHPLLRAYRDGNVCMVNNFRSEIGQKKAIFDLLGDETVTANFPQAEKKAIREFVPWTRMVHATRTTYQDEPIDLPEFILKNRPKLVLLPNDESSDQTAFIGAETDDTRWERALRSAMRSPYVVQEVVDPVYDMFPLLQYGHLEMRKMRIDLHPHTYLGKVQGCSSWLTAATASGFSTLAGVAPTFILEGK